MTKERHETPQGVRGFPGRGTAEGKNITLFDLHRPLPFVVHNLYQLPNETQWLRRGGWFNEEVRRNKIEIEITKISPHPKKK